MRGGREARFGFEGRVGALEGEVEGEVDEGKTAAMLGINLAAGTTFFPATSTL